MFASSTFWISPNEISGASKNGCRSHRANNFQRLPIKSMMVVKFWVSTEQQNAWHQPLPPSPFGPSRQRLFCLPAMTSCDRRLPRIPNRSDHIWDWSVRHESMWNRFAVSCFPCNRRRPGAEVERSNLSVALEKARSWALLTFYLCESTFRPKRSFATLYPFWFTCDGLAPATPSRSARLKKKTILIYKVGPFYDMTSLVCSCVLWPYDMPNK